MASKLLEQSDKQLLAIKTETNDPLPHQGGQIEKWGDTEQIGNETFVKAIFKSKAEGSNIAVCTKEEDPTKGGWLAKKATDDMSLFSNNNNYVNCSTFHSGEDAPFNVKKENFAALQCIVTDDVGTKIPWERFDGIVPSWVIETSPGNFQVGFVLSEPITDIKQAEALAAAVIDAGLSDKGMTGVSRWFRLPRGINGKEKYVVDGLPFQCRLVQWNPEQTYSIDELAEVLGLSLNEPEPSKSVDVTATVTENAEDEVVAKLKEFGLYKKKLGPGKHDITCPWVHEHTDQLDDGTAYFEPSADHKTGGFKCHHSHGSDLDIRELREFLGLVKPVIKVEPGRIEEILRAIAEILASTKDVFFYGKCLGKIVNPDDGAIEFKAFNNAELTLIMAQLITWVKPSKDQGWVPCDPPERHVRILFDGVQGTSTISELKGIARQPYFRESDGQLVTQPGYDPVSRLYGAFDPKEFQRLEPTRNNAEKSLALLRDLLSEFRFARPVDLAITFAAIMTATVRPSLDLAPGFHVHASTIGSGKSYLCKLISLFASAAPSEKVSYPTSDDDATKKILSLLMKSPGCIEFDDMSTNWKPFTILKQMFTSETVTDRLLGVNKTASASTRSLILGSGNNVVPERDMVRRIFTIYLDPQVETPAGLSYNGDPVTTVKQQRGRYVMAALNIIEAWKHAGFPESDLQDIASYNADWTKHCRQPLAWLGVEDPIQALVQQVVNDPDREVLKEVLEAIYDVYGSNPVTVRKMLKDIEDSPYSNGIADGRYERLSDALNDLPVIERGQINRGKLGWFFKRNKDKIVGGFKMCEAKADGRAAWQVIKVS